MARGHIPPNVMAIRWVQTTGLWGRIIRYPLPMQENQSDASNQRRGQPPGDRIDQRWQKQQMEIFIDPNIATIQGPSYYDRTAQTGRLQNYGFQGQYVGAGVAQLDTMNQAPTLNTSIVSAFKDALARRFGRAA